MASNNRGTLAKGVNGLESWASRLIRMKPILERKAVDSHATLHVFSKKHLGTTQERRG